MKEFGVRRSEIRRIRGAFTLLMILSLVALVGFIVLMRSSVFLSLGPWRASVLFGFSLVFALLSYRGADTAMFGAYVTAYFVANLSQRESTNRSTPREATWGLQPYLRRKRVKALANSAAALLYGAATIAAYVTFVCLGSCELARTFAWPRAATAVALIVVVFSLVTAVPAFLGSLAAFRTYFAVRADAGRKETHDDAHRERNP
ncbi:MAG: hypothetical protein WBC63_02210 [Candidatus Bipolaricaulia bacterium]